MENIGIKNIIMAVFVVGAIFAFMVFAGVIKLGSNAQVARGTVTIWGTIPFALMQPHIDREKDQHLSIIYKEKSINNYENELINALAAGEGPDLFILPHESILRNSNKLLEIPYASFPKNDYESTYIDEARLFLTETGVLAFPITVDPLIMYYNKPLMNSSYITKAPKYWGEFPEFSKQITRQTATGEVSVSGVALGTFDNIRHAKAIVSTMIIQNGNRIVGTDTTTGKKRAELVLDTNEVLKTEGALNFYTSFARFGSNAYSWNEALVEDRLKFTAGELAVYFGRGSEFEDLRKANPNIDIQISAFPQAEESLLRATNGAMIGIAISKQSKNIPAAISVASKIAGKETSAGLAKSLSVAPARLDLLTPPTDNPHLALVYREAVIARGWLDADPIANNTIFRALIRSINSGGTSIVNALQTANADINNVLNKTINTIIPDKF